MTGTALARTGPVRPALATGLAGVLGWLMAVRLVAPVGFRFLVVVVAVTAVLATLLAVVVRSNRDPTGYDRFTAATGVTVLRAGSLAVLTGFLVTPHGAAAWVPAALYAGAAGLDAVDGTLARITGTVTELGATLDTEVDALGLFVGSVLAVALGVAPVPYVLVGVARYVYVGARRWRRWRGKPLRSRPPTRVPQVNAGLQMTVLVVLLAPVPGPAISRVVAAVAMVPFLLAFLRDWLLVTGRLGTPRV